MFFVLAEILLYFSLFEFVNSIQTYAKMEYVGPQICPLSAPRFSFCSQTGQELFQAAQTMCGPVQRANHPITCTAYDFYQELDNGSHFGWDWTTMNFTEYDNEHDAYLGELIELADHLCGKQGADSAVQELCTGAVMSTVACPQARMASMMADDCSGKKQDDINKCRRVCNQIADETSLDPSLAIPLKTVMRQRLNYWLGSLLWLIKLLIIFRSIAGFIQVLKSCHTLVIRAKERRTMWFAVDVFGLCDPCEGARYQEDPLVNDDAELEEELLSED